METSVVEQFDFRGYTITIKQRNRAEGGYFWFATKADGTGAMSGATTSKDARQEARAWVNATLIAAGEVRLWV